MTAILPGAPCTSLMELQVQEHSLTPHLKEVWARSYTLAPKRLRLKLYAQLVDAHHRPAFKLELASSCCGTPRLQEGVFLYSSEDHSTEDFSLPDEDMGTLETCSSCSRELALWEDEELPPRPALILYSSSAEESYAQLLTCLKPWVEDEIRDPLTCELMLSELACALLEFMEQRFQEANIALRTLGEGS